MVGLIRLKDPSDCCMGRKKIREHGRNTRALLDGPEGLGKCDQI